MWTENHCEPTKYKHDIDKKGYFPESANFLKNWKHLAIYISIYKSYDSTKPNTNSGGS